MSEHDDLMDRLRRMTRQIDDVKATTDDSVRMAEDAERQFREKRAGDQIRETTEEPHSHPTPRQKQPDIGGSRSR